MSAEQNDKQIAKGDSVRVITVTDKGNWPENGYKVTSVRKDGYHLSHANYSGSCWFSFAEVFPVEVAS